MESQYRRERVSSCVVFFLVALCIFSSVALCSEVICGEYLRRSAGFYFFSLSEEVRLAVDDNEFIATSRYVFPGVLLKFSFPCGLKFLLSPKVYVGKFLTIELSPEYCYYSSNGGLFYKIGIDVGYLIFPETLVSPHVKAGFGGEYLFRTKVRRKNSDGSFYFSRWQMQAFCEVGKRVLPWISFRCGMKGVYLVSCLSELADGGRKELKGVNFNPSLFFGITGRYRKVQFVGEVSFIKELLLVFGVQKEFGL